MLQTRRQEPERICVVFGRGRSDECLHALRCRIVLVSGEPEIVVPQLKFCFRFSLLDPGLPDVLNGVPVIGIERVLRFGQ
jgi:hypothetical protein